MGAKTDKKIIDKIIKDLLEWAYDGEGIYLASYVYKTYKKPKSYLYDLSLHHPDLKKAMETARELIAARISNHCFEGDKNSTFGEKILPIYCKEYKALLKWKAELGKDNKDDLVSLQELTKLAKTGTLIKAVSQSEEKD